MKVQQTRWTKDEDWAPHKLEDLDKTAGLILVFGGTETLRKGGELSAIQKAFPESIIFGCSTAGEICSTEVTDDTISLVAVQFEHTQLKFVKETIKNSENSYEIGKSLIGQLDQTDLAHVFVLSDGLNVNGSELARGMTDSLQEDIALTGGLSGDGDRFKNTFVICDGQLESKIVAGIGFYGKHLQVGYGSLGGWDVFGMPKTVTRSQGNVLYELDGKSALEIYKKYLGEMAKDLPASGLLFPLDIQVEGQDTPIVRTILAVNEKEQSLTFAGDIPEGAKARLMKANFNRLIEGAVDAAKDCKQVCKAETNLAILISCVGRKLILKQRIEEEVEGVRDVLGKQAQLTGFYSYGEISPLNKNVKCELHNQTMTITTFSEK